MKKNDWLFSVYVPTAIYTYKIVKHFIYNDGSFVKGLRINCEKKLRSSSIQPNQYYVI